MFPLGSVLLPGMALPLHVFEPRYRDMMRRCTAAEGRFGVALIERGSEVGGGDVRTLVGCSADILEAVERSDGCWSVLAVGRERLRILSWEADDPHPWAWAEVWPDSDPGPERGADAEAVDLLEARHLHLMELLVAAGSVPGVPARPESPNPTERVWRLAIGSPLGAWDRQRLLAAPGFAERAELLAEMLEEQILLWGSAPR